MLVPPINSPRAHNVTKREFPTLQKSGVWRHELVHSLLSGNGNLREVCEEYSSDRFSESTFLWKLKTIDDRTESHRRSTESQNSIKRIALDEWQMARNVVRYFGSVHDAQSFNRCGQSQSLTRSVGFVFAWQTILKNLGIGNQINSIRATRCAEGEETIGKNYSPIRDVRCEYRRFSCTKHRPIF